MAAAPLRTTWSISADAASQVKAAVLGVLFVAAFWNSLHHLAIVWTSSEDWSHGPLIPVFSAYMIFLRWESLRRCPVRGCGLGLAILVVGLLAYGASLAYAFTYAKHLAMLTCLLGLLVFLLGSPALRYLWVPWLYLLFAIPLPAGAYFALTNPMRELAAVVATTVLTLFPNLDIQQLGSTIHYSYGDKTGELGVADACSGMRSSITLCAIGVAVAYAAERPTWHRLVLIASCIPFALLANVVRVVITCLLHIFVGAKYAEGNYHAMLGLATLMLAFGMFSGLGWVLSSLFVDEDDEDDDTPIASHASPAP